VLFHEATILDATERKHQMHSTMDEAMHVAAQVQPKTFVLTTSRAATGAGDSETAARESIGTLRHRVSRLVVCSAIACGKSQPMKTAPKALK
jgi:hypothetical protein